MLNYEDAKRFIDDISNIYGSRSATQKETSQILSLKYKKNITLKSVANITQQLGYRYGIERNKPKAGIYL